jgi:hypothetical protein
MTIMHQIVICHSRNLVIPAGIARPQNTAPGSICMGRNPEAKDNSHTAHSLAA